MRAVGVHADVVIVTSQFWQTTCTVVRSGDEAFVIDSPVLPAELEALPALVEVPSRRGPPVSRSGRSGDPGRCCLRSQCGA